ncbi:MAG: Tn3 family transposase, partial [Candidatus Pacebacteria bacterium]|nr:Tn3 family transposase [Candidatus Paceibacterota bacterium]
DDLVYLKELYTSIEEILPTLNLGYDGIRYYANSVIKSDIFQLNQRSLEDQYLHVIAFIAHQYYRLQDNLADVLLSVMRSYQNSSMREHRDSCYENRKQKDKTFKSSLKAFSNKIFNIFSEIYEIIEDTTLTDTDKVRRIKKLLGFPNAIAEESEQLENSLEQRSKDEKSYFDVLEDHSLRLQSRVTPIVKALDFQGEISSTALMEAITYFKEKDGVITKTAPLDFLDNEQRKAVFVKGEFRISLYKVFLFIHIASALKSGTLNLKHSYKYRSLDDYMISKERWRKEKEMLLTKASLTDLANPSTLLDALDKKLHHQYQEINQLYLEGNNLYLKVNKNGDFTINTPKKEENSDSELLQSLFPDQPVALTEVLSTVNRHTKFLEEFQHWQQRYAKNKTTDKTLYAGIIGKGCAIGTPKIARISSEISENNLNNVINWYFSLDNVQAANDRIIKLMDSMELPDIYRKSKDSLHTASDGQKYTVRTDSLNANYSFKYFGKEQGVSAYTFIDERNFLWHSLVFSAAERESAYVIDGLMHNDVVRSDIHSTDTHGYSEAIFAITHLLGFSYAPRIKNLKKQILYTFKSRKKNIKKEWGIAPSKYINKDIIEETWDDVLRLVTTIKLKEYTASEIFRRLNSYSKQHALYKGLKAFGQIIKSQFILRYLSEVELRQAIEKQLNKVELANRFSRAVAVGDPRGFTQGEKEEQEIAESCNRLIKNAIICWNYIYLSDKTVRLKKQPEQQQVLLSSIATHSPISWAHVNLLGEYDFSDKRLKDSFKLKAPKLIA